MIKRVIGTLFTVAVIAVIVVTLAGNAEVAMQTAGLMVVGIAIGAAIGIILSESMKYISAGMWWPAVFPGAVLVLIVLMVDKLGDNLRMIIDPYSAQE